MNKILMKGNEAIAQAAINAGCRHYFGYPITPQNEIGAYMSKHMIKAGGTFLQAESEIAAINMVLGAAAGGKRAMTSSSSPGISLKSEAISYLAACDLPCLIVNVQRGGPGLGGIQPSQADYFQATKALGHGDFNVIVLAPSSVQEMFDLTFKSFELAEKWRMPVLMLADGMLGQMMEPVVIDREISPENLTKQVWAASGHSDERAPNYVNSLIIDPELLEKSVLARYERYAKIQQEYVEFEEFMCDDADIVIVAYGASFRISKVAAMRASEEGIKVGIFRPISLWPFPFNAIKKLNAKQFLTVEMSMGQMVGDVRAAVEYNRPVHFYGRTGGMLVDEDEIYNEIMKIAEGM